MPVLARSCLGLFLFLAAVVPLRGQSLPFDDVPAPFVPRRPETRSELDRREALKLYALGLMRERDDRLLDAVRVFEDARQLHPEGAFLHRALIPLYLALCRTDEALAACRKVVELDPGDYATWGLYARQLKEQGRRQEALDALERAVACPSVKEHPELLVQLFYEQAILYEDSRDYPRAETAFRAVAKILENPQPLLEIGPFDRAQLKTEAAKTYEGIGRVCTKAQHYDRAVAAFIKAQELDPERAGRLSYHLAKVYMAQDRTEKALEFLNQYLRTQPPGTEAYEDKIRLLQKLGRAADVLPELKHHLDLDEHNLALKLLVARQYAREGQTTEAERLYTDLADTSPTAEVFRGLFTLYKDNGRLDEGLVLLNRAVKAATPPKEGRSGDAAAAARARAILAMLRDDADLAKPFLSAAWRAVRKGERLEFGTRSFLAALASRTHQLTEAEQFFRDCLQDVRENPQSEASIYIGLVRILWEARKVGEVEKVCREGLEKAQATNRVFFHVELARALLQQEKTDEAIKEADEAVKLAGEDDRLLCRLTRAGILAQAGRYEQAVAECQALLKERTQPGELLEVRYTLSSIYSDAKDYAKAEAQLRRILKANPDSVRAYNDLGYIMADQGKNLEESERLIRKAIDLDRQQKRIGTDLHPADEDNAAYLDSLGWVLFRRGQLEEARGWLEKASALADGASDPVVWDHLADVYYRLDQADRARTTWEKALTLYEKEKRRPLDERYEEIKRKLKMLEGAAHQ
jgi:tetratricopeptide (TPR) repeat protein